MGTRARGRWNPGPLATDATICWVVVLHACGGKTVEPSPVAGGENGHESSMPPTSKEGTSGGGGTTGTTAMPAASSGAAGRAVPGLPCDDTTPDGPSVCCPVEYPVWCRHAYSVGHCFKIGSDCSTVKLCPPESFARTCGPGDYVVCWGSPCFGGNYGGCRFSEPQCQ